MDAPVYGLQAPNFMDELFAGETDVFRLIQELSQHPRFVEAVAKGVTAESRYQEALTTVPPHPGPGQGQTGRNVFLNALGLSEADYRVHD